MSARAGCSARRLAHVLPLVTAVYAASLGAQGRGPSMGPASIRAYRDSVGVASYSSYASAGFGFVLDAATGVKGAVRLDANGNGALVLLGQGSAMTPSAHTVSLSRLGTDSVLGIDAMGWSRRLTQVPLHDENIEFTRDSFMLRGSFVRPVSAGRHPALLLLNGSGPSPRGLLANFAGIFAANGVAALVYDKRGTGASSGASTPDDFGELSDDVRAALRYLRSRPDVDTTRIGILGTSQGVYTAMMVAATDPGIRFIISSSGGAFPGDQELYRRVRAVADSGYGADAQAQARTFLAKLFPYYAAVGSGSTSVDTLGLAALYRSAAAQKWWPIISGPSTDPTTGSWPPARKIFAADLGRDWTGIYQHVNAAVYAVNAADDQLVPPDIAQATMARYLPRGSAQLQTKPLSGDHGFTVMGPDGMTPVYDPRYLPLLIDWAVTATKR